MSEATMTTDKPAKIEPIAQLLNGTYTIENKETGECRTFRVRTQEAHRKFMPGGRLVSLLVGPDNGHSYEGFGHIEGDFRIRIWRNKQSKPGEKASAWEHYGCMLWDLATGGGRYADRYTISWAGTCYRCNRKLTTPESIRRGIGPTCAGLI